jgi:hypothetical protein
MLHAGKGDSERVGQLDSTQEGRESQGRIAWEMLELQYLTISCALAFSVKPLAIYRLDNVFGWVKYEPSSEAHER